MMKLLLPLLNLLLLTWLGWKVYRQQPLNYRWAYWPALSVKIVCGIALGLIYFYHYQLGDTISFWQDGCRLAEIFLERPSQVMAFLWDDAAVPEITLALQQQTPRSLFFVKICGVLALVSGGNYWMMATWLSALSFAGAWLLFVRLIRLFPATGPAAAIALLILPSVVFWSSGLIKESVGLAALFVLMAGCLSIVRGGRVSGWEWLLMLMALWVGWNLKYYWIGIFLPVSLPVVVVHFLEKRFPVLKPYTLMLWVVFFIGFLAFATNIHPNFYASRFLEVIYLNNLDFTRLSEPPRIVQYFNLEPVTTSVLMNAPAALIAGLFRPFVWEAFNTLSLLASLENLVLTLVVLQGLFALRRAFRSTERVLLVATLVYALLLITFLALSTPNFGTLSRYRIGALPVIILLCLLPQTPLGRWLAARKWFG